MKRSKRVQANLELVREKKRLPMREALELVQKARPAKFDETVELALRLGIDIKKSDQMVRGAVSLPKGIGKELRVIAFAQGEKAEEARQAGAAEVGGEDLAKRIEGGWLDFDVAVASPDMMRVVGKLGRVLGPQGKMPSPKAGTVTPNVADAVREFKAGKVGVRADAGGIVHAPVGKRSFAVDDLMQNVEAMLQYIRGLKPPTSRGTYVLSAAVSTTMGPGVFVEGV